MNIKRDKRIDGEYDPPLSERLVNPTEAEKEKIKKDLEKLFERHPNLKDKYKHLL